MEHIDDSMSQKTERPAGVTLQAAVALCERVFPKTAYLAISLEITRPRGGRCGVEYSLYMCDRSADSMLHYFKDLDSLVLFVQAMSPADVSVDEVIASGNLDTAAARIGGVA